CVCYCEILKQESFRITIVSGLFTFLSIISINESNFLISNELTIIISFFSGFKNNMVTAKNTTRIPAKTFAKLNALNACNRFVPFRLLIFSLIFMLLSKSLTSSAQKALTVLSFKRSTLFGEGFAYLNLLIR